MPCLSGVSEADERSRSLRKSFGKPLLEPVEGSGSIARSDPVVEGCASGGRLLGTDAVPASEAGAPLHDHWAIAITALRTQRTHQIEARVIMIRITRR
jgi:hypothetical protein